MAWQLAHSRASNRNHDFIASCIMEVIPHVHDMFHTYTLNALRLQSESCENGNLEISRHGMAGWPHSSSVAARAHTHTPADGVQLCEWRWAQQRGGRTDDCPLPDMLLAQPAPAALPPPRSWGTSSSMRPAPMMVHASTEQGPTLCSQCLERLGWVL